jgi:hypothetical protein
MGRLVYVTRHGTIYRFVRTALIPDLTATLLVVLRNQIRGYDSNDSLVLTDPRAIQRIQELPSDLRFFSIE